MGTVSLPFGPSTEILSPMEIFTPFGNGMSLFPTLDINSPVAQVPTALLESGAANPGCRRLSAGALSAGARGPKEPPERRLQAGLPAPQGVSSTSCKTGLP